MNLKRSQTGWIDNVQKRREEKKQRLLVLDEVSI